MVQPIWGVPRFWGRSWGPSIFGETTIWVVVKIMVPFLGTQILGAVV